MARASKWVTYFIAIFAFLPLTHASPTVYFTPANLSMAITENTTLYSNLTAGNLTIANGLTLRTNGYEIYVANTLVAQSDTFITGSGPAGGYGCNGCGGQPGTPAVPSFGGSGGAGGGWANEWGGGDGGSTQVRGGRSHIGTGDPGGVPPDPILNNTNIAGWYYSGMQNYLEGAGGGGGGEASSSAGHGGAGAFGLYIQAGQMVLTNTLVYAAGTNGIIGYINGGGGGGGGGCGRIAIAYQTLYLPATYNTAGGAAGPWSGEGGFWGGSGGGPCNVMVFQYSTEPITVLGTPLPPLNQTGGPCYLANGITLNRLITIYLAGSWFDLSANAMNFSGITATINSVTYLLKLGQLQQMPPSGGYSYIIELRRVNSATGSADLAICSIPLPSTTTSSTTSTSSTSTSISLTTTTILQSPPQSDPGEEEEIGGLSIILLIIALIGFFSDNEKRRRNGV